MRFFIFLMGLFLIGEAIFNFCTWVYFSSHVSGFKIGPLESWLHGMGPLVVGTGILFYFLVQYQRRRSRTREFECACGESLEMEFSENDFAMGGANIVCPECGIISWIPVPGGGKAVFFKRPGEEYTEYSQYLR